ncbi:MAG: hypothetical protein ACTSYI_03400 [Promethearchaeota archaeon]
MSLESDRKIRTSLVGRRGRCSGCNKEFPLEELSHHSQGRFPNRTINSPNLCDVCYENNASINPKFEI